MAREIFRDSLGEQILDAKMREEIGRARELPTTRVYSAYGISMIVAELTPGGEHACKVLWMAEFAE